MMTQIQYWNVVDQASENSQDKFGRIVVTVNDVPIALRFWTTIQMDYCPVCGLFVQEPDHAEKFHPVVVELDEAEGWEKGENVTQRWVSDAWKNPSLFAPVRHCMN